MVIPTSYSSPPSCTGFGALNQPEPRIGHPCALGDPAAIGGDGLGVEMDLPSLVICGNFAWRICAFPTIKFNLNGWPEQKGRAVAPKLVYNTVISNHACLSVNVDRAHFMLGIVPKTHSHTHKLYMHLSFCKNVQPKTYAMPMRTHGCICWFICTATIWTPNYWNTAVLLFDEKTPAIGGERYNML